MRRFGSVRADTALDSTLESPCSVAATNPPPRVSSSGGGGGFLSCFGFGSHPALSSLEDTPIVVPVVVPQALPLVHADVMRALWHLLGADDRRALRACCKATRNAVERHASGLEGQGSAPVLSPATCARLSGVHALTLRSMACVRGMLGAFPQLQSTRLLLDQGGAAIEDVADYEAIANAAPWLTHLGLQLPASATALPPQLGALLSACSKLDELELHADGQSELVDVGALAAGTQLLRLGLSNFCSSLTNLAPLSAMANLTSLDIHHWKAVSDLAPLAVMVNLRSLNINHCTAVSDLAPLTVMVNLHSLNISGCVSVRDLTPLGALENLQSLDMHRCSAVCDLSPLAALANLHSLDIGVCKSLSDLAPLTALTSLTSLDIRFCEGVSDLSPLAALVNLQRLDISDLDGLSNLAPLGSLVSLQTLILLRCTAVSDLAPLAAVVQLQSLDMCGCIGVSDVAPLAALVNLQNLKIKNCKAVSDLAPLAALVKLTSLDFSNCTLVSDLSPLKALVNLKKLSMQQSSSLCGVFSVSDLPSLQRQLDLERSEDKDALSLFSGFSYGLSGFLA
ncbi:hypothetical protein FOA52_002170 [Chlamydomonas sp. UWO 241]|nr:hypothetical protein FOA52_002170 [Chlamydomonas sp. UWO 241]